MNIPIRPNHVIPLTVGPNHVIPLTVGPPPYWPWPQQYIPAGYVPAPIPQVVTTGKINVTIAKPCDCRKPDALRPSDV